MPFTSGNIQTRDGTVGGKNGAFENLACAGMTNLTIPDSREIFMGIKNTARGLVICADSFQYTDFCTHTNKCTRCP